LRERGLAVALTLLFVAGVVFLLKAFRLI